MVQQAYVHRLALGRSAFEPHNRPNSNQDADTGETGESEVINLQGNIQPSSDYVQLYNSRGHPCNSESRSQVRRTIRAYNEVLSTVDVCARVDSDGKDIQRKDHYVEVFDALVEEENEVGVWIRFMERLLWLTTTTVTVNLRRRIQAFDIYAGVPILSIMKIEMAREGIFQFFLAGQFANTFSGILEGSANNFIDIAHDMLMERFVIKHYCRKHRPQHRIIPLAIKTGSRIASFAVSCALFPIQFYAGMQRLNLVPLWPLLPSPFAKSFFANVYPPLPRGWDRSSLTVWSASFFTSPMVITFGTFYIADVLQSRLLHYGRSAIPRPSNPDHLSVPLMQEELYGSDSILDYSMYQTSLGVEVWKDFAGLVEGANDIRMRFRNAVRKLFLGKRNNVEFPDLVNDRVVADANASPRHVQIESSSDNHENGMVDTATAPRPLSLVTAEASTATQISPLLTPLSSDYEEEYDDGNTSNVRIRTRTGSTSTLHMDVEFNTSERAGGPVYTSSFSASPNPVAIIETTLTGPRSDPHHRVTTLSLFPAEALSAHSADVVLTLLRLPIEAYCIRAIARHALGSRSPPSWLLQHVYPSNCWFGISPTGSWDYPTKILLCLGMEWIITVQTWQGVSKLAMWFGRQCFGWGKL